MIAYQQVARQCRNSLKHKKPLNSVGLIGNQPLSQRWLWIEQSLTPLCLSLSDLNVACWRAHEKLIQLFGRFTGRSRLDQGLVVEPEDPLASH